MSTTAKVKQMKQHDFTTTLVVDQSPEEVFKAINNVKGWWSEGVKGGTEELNDDFTYRHKEFHYSKQQLVEVVPNEKVVWLITDSTINFVENKSEWTGTRVSFEITRKGDKTEIRFVHRGLVPELECYDACSGGWNYYLPSLLSLITTGKGTPDPKDLK